MGGPLTPRRTVVFFVQLEPDVDHIAPIVYRLEKDHPGTTVVISTNVLWDLDDDYRVRYLRDMHGVGLHPIHKVDQGSLKAIRTVARLIRWLPRAVLRLVPSQWWSRFYFDVVGHAVDVSWAVAYFRSVGAGCVVVDEAQPNAPAIHTAARQLEIPVVMVQTANRTLKYPPDHRPGPVANADFLVLPNRLTQSYAEEPDRMLLLGCMRYCDEWQRLNSRLVREAFPDSDLPDESGRLKVLVFGWGTKGFTPAHPTIRRLRQRDDLSVIFKPRPRTTTPRKVHDRGYNRYPSARLIQWSDVVISPISSVIQDILYYDKLFIYPKFVAPQDSGTFEDYGVGWRVNDEQELFGALDEARRHPDRRPYRAEDVRRFVRDAVYAGDCGDDVLGAYARVLAAIGARGPRTSATALVAEAR